MFFRLSFPPTNLSSAGYHNPRLIGDVSFYCGMINKITHTPPTCCPLPHPISFTKIQNETGEMRKQLEERDTKSIRLKTARASEPNLLFLEERGDPLDKETLVKESTEPSQGQPLSPQESARGETASRKGHHRSRKPTRDSSSNKCSNAYSECKASRDATNPGSMQDTKRVRSTNGLKGLSADEVSE